SSSWVCHGKSPSQRTMRTTASLTSARSTRCHASCRPSTTLWIEMREPAGIGLRLAIEVEIAAEAVHPAPAPVAGLLVAAERAGRVEAVEGVGPHHAGLHGGDHLEDPASLLGPHPRGEAVGRVVRLLDGLLRGPEGEDRQHRAKDLLLGDPVALADAGEERGPEEVATRGKLAIGLEDLCALLHTGVDELLDLGQLGRRVYGSDVGVFVERIPYPEGREARLELVQER